MMIWWRPAFLNHSWARSLRRPNMQRSWWAGQSSVFSRPGKILPSQGHASSSLLVLRSCARIFSAGIIPASENHSRQGFRTTRKNRISHTRTWGSRSLSALSGSPFWGYDEFHPEDSRWSWWSCCALCFTISSPGKTSILDVAVGFPSFL